MIFYDFHLHLTAELGFCPVLNIWTPAIWQVEEGLENAAQDYLADLKQDGEEKPLGFCHCVIAIASVRATPNTGNQRSAERSE